MVYVRLNFEFLIKSESLCSDMIDANGTVTVKQPPNYAFPTGSTQGVVATTYAPGFGGSSLPAPYSNMIVGGIRMPPPPPPPLSTGGGDSLFITGTNTQMPVAYTMQGPPPLQAMLRSRPTRMDEALEVSADVHRLYRKRSIDELEFMAFAEQLRRWLLLAAL